MSVLFFNAMKYHPEDPKSIHNDRFILSKVPHTHTTNRCTHTHIHTHTHKQMHTHKTVLYLFLWTDCILYIDSD